MPDSEPCNIHVCRNVRLQAIGIVLEPVPGRQILHQLGPVLQNQHADHFGLGCHRTSHTLATIVEPPGIEGEKAGDDLRIPDGRPWHAWMHCSLGHTAQVPDIRLHPVSIAMSLYLERILC